MNDAPVTHGRRLRAIAERVFDRATLDRVILPAIADLQHECSSASGGASSRRLIHWRAYWSIWKTFGICLLSDGVSNHHGAAATIARRAAMCLTSLVPVLLLPVAASTIFSSESHFTFGEGLAATLLLLPQAALPFLPVAFFFALVLYRKEERPDGATVIPTVIAGTLICVILVSVLSALVVPKANDAYQSLAFETLQRRARAYALRPPQEPAKGVSEMTWWELRDQSTQAADTTAQARAAARLQEHLAFVALVPVLALLGYALSNRGRSRRGMFAMALALRTLYYVCFSLSLTNFAQPYLYGPWVVNCAFLLLASSLLWSASPAEVAPAP